jgi:hypothetical protein
VCVYIYIYIYIYTHTLPIVTEYPCTVVRGQSNASGFVSKSVYLCMICFCFCRILILTSQKTYRTPGRTLSQLEKCNFLGEKKTHWPGRCCRIKRSTTLLPSRGHFRKQTCDAIPLGRYGLRHTSCWHSSK